MIVKVNKTVQMKKEIKVYALLQVRQIPETSQKINRLFLTEAIDLEDALLKSEKQMLSLKDSPAFYSLSTFVTMNIDKSKEKVVIVKEDLGVKQEKNKQDYIYALNLAKEKYAKSSQEKKALERIINRI